FALQPALIRGRSALGSPAVERMRSSAEEADPRRTAGRMSGAFALLKLATPRDLLPLAALAGFYLSAADQELYRAKTTARANSAGIDTGSRRPPAEHSLDQTPETAADRRRSLPQALDISEVIRRRQQVGAPDDTGPVQRGRAREVTSDAGQRRERRLLVRD